MMSLSAWATSSSGPRLAGRTTRSAVTRTPRCSSIRTASSSGTTSAGVPATHTTSEPTNHPVASPKTARAGTTALTTRWMGTKARSRIHHQRRQRAGSHGPDTVSTAASIAIHRGSSRNCDRSESSRSLRSKCHVGAAMPFSLTDNARKLIAAAVAYAQSRRHCRAASKPTRTMNGSARIARP
ncbi:Uncharacterised protein [Mycobacteroides abscessus subsp. abscessus]|nr:Uncharacterised protein [Mycobacteroides abscessus subsp. abscessus]